MQDTFELLPLTNDHKMNIRHMAARLIYIPIGGSTEINMQIERKSAFLGLQIFGKFRKSKQSSENAVRAAPHHDVC